MALEKECTPLLIFLIFLDRKKMIMQLKYARKGIG